MDEITPRGIIRGVLTTTSVSKSAKTLRPRKTPGAANVRETPVNPPSHAEVASRLLTRSRSSNKRKATSVSGTPSESTTPRTLIAGFLQAAPVAKSVVKVKKQKTVTSDAVETSITTGTSLHEDNTPRTTIQNLLREAITETPEESIFLPSLGVEDDNTPQQTNEEEAYSPLMKSNASDDERTDSVEHSVAMTTAHQADDVMVMEVSYRQQDSNEDESQGAMQYDNETQGLDSSPSMVTTEQALQTDTVNRGESVQISGQWRDLVTPQLPLDVSTVGGRQLSEPGSDVTKRSAGEKKFFGGKPPAGRTAVKSSKKPAGPRMPTNLVKNIFQHFSKAKLSREALQAVENGSNLFFKQVSSDLMAYCQHAHRTTIELADVELLMKRQGFITDNQSLYSLVEKYLPLEYRQEIIPTVQAGNKIVLQ